jgi:DMSO/TMAO reductase YedYZ molybdopterin-dependent catalytic subunit
MAGRRTNVALLLLLIGALATGVLAFAIGTSWGVVVVVAHGVLGFAIVALAPWKSVIVRKGMKRSRAGRAASVVLTIVVVVALATGILHATGLLVRAAGITAMQVHVGAALIALPLGVWHVLARRTRPRRTDLTRRNLIKAGAVLGGAGAAYAAVELAARPIGLPGADRRFTGSHERGSFSPESMPVTQWFNDSVPHIDGSDWMLSVITGEERKELPLTDLAAYQDELTTKLDCTGGWYATQSWTGVRLDRLIGHVEGRSILVKSVTGYSRRFPLGSAQDLLLATRVADAPLSAGHGFPARIVAPGRRGFWWVKWVTSIEVDDHPWWLQWPFPPT